MCRCAFLLSLLVMHVAAAEASVPHADAAGTKPRLIVLEPQGEGIGEAALRALDDMVLTEISKQDRYEVLGSSDLKRMLGAVELQQKVGCETSADSCLAELGGAVGAQFLATTSLAKMGSQYLVNVKLIDVVHARVVERRSEQVPANEDALVSAVRRLVASLAPASAPRNLSFGWAAIAVGGVATGLFGVLLYGAVEENAAGDIETASTRAVGANVSLGVAAVAFAGGTVLFLFGGGGGSGGDAAEGER